MACGWGNAGHFLPSFFLVIPLGSATTVAPNPWHRARGTTHRSSCRALLPRGDPAVLGLPGVAVAGEAPEARRGADRGAQALLDPLAQLLLRERRLGLIEDVEGGVDEGALLRCHGLFRRCHAPGAPADLDRGRQLPVERRPGVGGAVGLEGLGGEPEACRLLLVLLRHLQQFVVHLHGPIGLLSPMRSCDSSASSLPIVRRIWAKFCTAPL